MGSVRLVREMLFVKKLSGCDLYQIFNLLLCGFLPFLFFFFVLESRQSVWLKVSFEQWFESNLVSGSFR